MGDGDRAGSQPDQGSGGGDNACAPVKKAHMTQSRRISLVEAAANVIVGYALAVGMQIAVFPLFGIHIALGDQLAIGLAFTGVSLARGYVLRRLFERFR